MQTVTAFLSAHPELVGFITYLLIGLVAHALRGTPLGALLQALGLDLSRLRTVPAAAAAPLVAPVTAPLAAPSTPLAAPSAPPAVVITELPPSAPSRIPPVTVLVLALGALFARDLVACTPAQRAAANTIVTPFLPFACAELANVTHGGVLVAQLCADQAKKAADILLAQSKGLGNGVGACGAHETILDAKGAIVGWACESGGMADEIAASIGGRVVK